MMRLKKIDLAIKAVICAIIVAMAMPAMALADKSDHGRRRGRDNNKYERSFDRHDRRDDDDDDRRGRRRFNFKKFKQASWERNDHDRNDRNDHDRKGDRRGRRGDDRFALRFFR
ncbi:MAG: hypothetical protein ABI882_03125 [Acidobacteriota bacterium]